MDLVVVIILLAIVQFIVFGALVGLTRNKFAVHAPATEGNESWERRFRVQQNTMDRHSPDSFKSMAIIVQVRRRCNGFPSATVR
jgi:hypothetical protein